MVCDECGVLTSRRNLEAQLHSMLCSRDVFLEFIEATAIVSREADRDLKDMEMDVPLEKDQETSASEEPSQEIQVVGSAELQQEPQAEASKEEDSKEGGGKISHFPRSKLGYSLEAPPVLRNTLGRWPFHLIRFEHRRGKEAGEKGSSRQA